MMNAAPGTEAPGNVRLVTFCHISYWRMRKSNFPRRESDVLREPGRRLGSLSRFRLFYARPPNSRAWFLADMSRQTRVKTYSAQTGIVYQYLFAGQKPARRRWLRRGTEYFFNVSPDRKRNYRLVIFLDQRVTAAWARQHGRALSSSEEYAAAKLRLFEAFDVIEQPELEALGLEVSGQQLAEFLSRLGLD